MLWLIAAIPVSSAAIGCSPAINASIHDTGMIPVDFFRASNLTCDAAVRLAINASIACGGGNIFFATPCKFETTVAVEHSGITFQGGNLGGSPFVPGPQTVITGPRSGPVFIVQHCERVLFDNLGIVGWHTGVIVTDAANVRFTRCAVHALSMAGGADDVDLSTRGCDGCNVVFGSNNTALVVENSFWISAEKSHFFFYPNYLTNGSTPSPHDRGQRPSIILRGNTPGQKYNVDTVYLLSFREAVLSGGQIQYQQVVQGEQWPGFYDFKYITSEVSASPLLDVQAKPGIKGFMGVQAVSVIDYNGADIMQPHYLNKYSHLSPESVGCKKETHADCPGLVPIVALNCSKVPGCKLSGLTVISASAFEGGGTRAPAVRVFDGQVDAVTVLSSQLTGAADVLDATNTPVGAWASRSAGGFTIVGKANSSAVGNARLTAGSGAKARSHSVEKGGGHALLVGESGEKAARLAVETNGALRWGDGQSSDFETTLEKMISNTTLVDLPPLKPMGVASVNVTAKGAAVGDVATATLSSLGDALVFVSARVAAPSRVLVLLRNEGEGAVDPPPGVMRVAVSQFS